VKIHFVRSGQSSRTTVCGERVLPERGDAPVCSTRPDQATCPSCRAAS
jgi:hypothetical protein